MVYYRAGENWRSSMTEARESGTAVDLEGGAKQRQRAVFIEFMALFLGEVSRSDIVEFFGVSPAAATRDLAHYMGELGGQIKLDGTTKAYRPLPDFQPRFEHPMPQVLSALSSGIGLAQNQAAVSLIPSSVPRPISLPSWEILAPISRAIAQRRVVEVEYHSYSSGKTVRELAPHALINNGSRWHIRAFDRRRKEFNDFVLTRLSRVTELPQSAVAPAEQPSEDIQWTRIVELELVPHPHQKRPEVTAMDFDMRAGVLHVRERAALAGYLLRQWNVDCSPDHSQKSPPAELDPDKQKGEEIRLWMRNHLALYGVSSAKMAPGYVPPET